jgi:hypothetical protein
MSQEDSSTSCTAFFPITIKNLGSPYRRSTCLYDVEGKPVKDIYGNPVNLYCKTLQQTFDMGCIHVTHVLRPGYRYFTTDSWQKEYFMESRKHGHPDQGKTFFVYYDEDFDLRQIDPSTDGMAVYR